MEITVIHGQSHKGSTYHISEMIKQTLTDEDTVVHEYFMPSDTPDYCIGCYSCIEKGEKYCPHADKVQEIVKSMSLSQIIIIDSPTYCYEMTGQLKTFFDHLAYIWLSHRPRKEMFKKVAIVVSTAAGSGSGSVTKSMARQLFWWGVPKIYLVNFNVHAASWKGVSKETMQKIIQKVEGVSQKVKGEIVKVRPNLKTIFMFSIMRKMQSTNDWNMIDSNYWKENNWIATERPWR